ncbi:MAG: anthranilate phosphoribosyltransferase [Coriobacteriaceae bacterium]|nr:anthranilate phosphoribosyltransferase [Coriobacteriaceae bacterium]
MIKEAIAKVVTGEDLTAEESFSAMREIMSGEATPTQIAAFLAALSTKSDRAETADEIAGAARAMRELAEPVEHPGLEVLEIVGTGGDGSNTFNISTTAALIAAGAGAHVAKHGNRAASSSCGTADCMEALGVNLDQDPALAQRLIETCGIAFLFAQRYHRAMRYVAPIRRELGFRTIFNILGPLTNPARPEFFLLGVYDETLVESVAAALAHLGVRHALVVHGQDGMDEISLSAPTTVCELSDGALRTYAIAPEDFGLARCSKADLTGSTPAGNAALVRAILAGEEVGARRDAALLNAAAALYAAGIAPDIAGGLERARAALVSGAALRTLDSLVATSQDA